MMSRDYAVYIMSNKYGTVLYTGVTNNLVKRVFEHQQKTHGFTARYNVIQLVYYEIYQDVTEAIKREKQIKGGSRYNKIRLIRAINPTFRDLYKEIL